VYSLSYTNPYYTVDGISAGFDVYHRKTDTSSLSIARYNTNSTGGGLRLGVPISDTDSIGVGLAVDATKLGVYDSGTRRSPQRYIDYVAKNGDSYNSLVPTANWSRNSIDSRIYPTEGTIARVGVEFGTPPGSLEYYKLTAQHQHYWKLSNTFTLYTNAEVGYADSFGGKDYPFFKNFYAGGMGSVRGYDTGTLGPTDTRDTVYGVQRLGGTRKAVGTVELLFPMPGSGTDKSWRLGTFIDAGQVWGEGAGSTLKDLNGFRYSAGVSVMWSSPMGPLKFSLGVPLNKQDTDKTQMLQFTMGQTF
jgi:outer membrane protein insertion porin family